VTVFGTFLAFLDATVVNVAFPDIERSFPDATLPGLSWVLNAYNVVFAALLLPAGRIADVIGHRRVFFIGLGLFTAMSGVCAGAPSAEVLVGGRVLQAAGAAMLIPSALTLLLSVYDPGRRAEAVGLAAVAGGVAAALGPSLGGLLVEWSGWRVIFLVNLPIGLLVGLRAWSTLPRLGGDRSARVPDLLGTAMLAAGVGVTALALVEGPDWGWGDWRVVLAFAAALVLLPLSVLRARRHPAPALERRLLRVRGFAVANAATAIFAAAFFAKILCDILFLTSVWGYAIVTAGLAMSPSPLITAATAGLASRLATRYGHRAVVVPGAILYAAGNAWYALMIPAQPDYVTHFLPATVLTGVGIACAFPMLTSAAVQSSGAASMGAACGANATARQLGGVLGIAVLVALVGTPGNLDALGSFHAGWAFIASCAAASAVVALWLPRTAESRAPAVAPAPTVGRVTSAAR
jgi:EmrB/QacA subfamily drug resistance transporter